MQSKHTGSNDKDIDTYSTYQEGAIKQGYNRSDEEYYRGNPKIKQQTRTSEVVHTFLFKWPDSNKILKVMDKKVFNAHICPWQ